MMARKPTFDIPAGQGIPAGARVVGARTEPGRRIRLVVAADREATRELIKDTNARRIA